MHDQATHPGLREHLAQMLGVGDGSCENKRLTPLLTVGGPRRDHQLVTALSVEAAQDRRREVRIRDQRPLGSLEAHILPRRHRVHHRLRENPVGDQSRHVDLGQRDRNRSCRSRIMPCPLGHGVAVRPSSMVRGASSSISLSSF